MNDMFEASAFEWEALPFAGEFQETPEMQEYDFEEPEWESEFRGRFSQPRGVAMFRSPRTQYPRPREPGLRPPWGFAQKHRWPRRTIARPFGFGLIDATTGAATPKTSSEYVRWAQSALNDVLRLQLPLHGIMDTATRSAVRSFQQRANLPADGVIGPDTERALIAARNSASGGDAGPPASTPGGPPTGGGAPAPQETEAGAFESEYWTPTRRCGCASCRQGKPCGCRPKSRLARMRPRYAQPDDFEFEEEPPFGEFETNFDLGAHESSPFSEFDVGASQTCDKIEPATLRVPFRIDFEEFLKLLCCAIGRWMPFRTDRPPGRQARCFVKRNEALLWNIHTEMFVKKIPCVELLAQYCRQKGATTDVTLSLKRFLNTACPPSSLCKTGVCAPSAACPPGHPPKSEPRSARCAEVDKLTKSICDNAKRICKLADDLNDPSSRAKCEQARTNCTTALENSKNCDTVMDCRSGTCVRRPRSAGE